MSCLCRREQEELRELRRQLVYKARPMPASQAQPFAVRGSDKPLTEPQSPALGKAKRLGGGAVRL